MSLPEAVRATILTREVLALLGALSAPGEETRVVGGAVRNALIGTRIEDFDLATTMLPLAVMEKARAAGWKVVPTGIEHGTVSVVIEGRAFEVTTLREDIATDGRRAEVRFGRSFEEDAARRDFTINAMSVGSDGVLHDTFGGQADLAAGRVRFIGDAATRLKEDYLRGLRFFRFSATYGHAALDPAGLAAVNAGRAGFARLSRERVRQEFLKLIMAPRVVEVMAQAQETQLVSTLIGLPVDIGFLQARINLGEASAMARLFALCVRAAQDVAHLRESLKLSNAELKLLERLDQAVRRHAGTVPESLRAMAADAPDVAREVVMQLSLKGGQGFAGAGLAAIEPMPVFTLTGKDALALGLPHGPEVGEALAKARALWIVRGAVNDRIAQLALLKEALG